MTITTAIILGLFISFVLIIWIVIGNPFQFKKKNDHQDLIDSIHERIAKANAGSGEHFSLESQSKATQDFYKNAEFVNKHCTDLDDFIINDQINEFDLRKLADLNGIQLQMGNGWYPMVIDLIKELYENGWDKRVSCIKEKYASLRFYTERRYGDTIHDIIERYEHKSERICETCGESGEIRYQSSWQYVACWKHYREDLGKVKAEANGFWHNEIFYVWSDVKDAYFDNLDYYQKYKFLKLEFQHAKVKYPGWGSNRLFVSKHTIGFGAFLNHLPKTFKGLDYGYIRNFENVTYCEICGYQAVYFGTCECCEKDTWTEYFEKWNREGKGDDAEKYLHIKQCQLYWTKKGGEICEAEQKNYPKNPAYSVLFTEEEIKKYLEYKDVYEDEEQN